jgi:hypothetical protein
LQVGKLRFLRAELQWLPQCRIGVPGDAAAASTGK